MTTDTVLDSRLYSIPRGDPGGPQGLRVYVVFDWILVVVCAVYVSTVERLQVGKV